MTQNEGYQPGQPVFVHGEGPGTVVRDCGFRAGPGRRRLDRGVIVTIDADGVQVQAAHAQTVPLDPATYLYSVTCCTYQIAVHRVRESRCPGCGSAFAAGRGPA